MKIFFRFQMVLRAYAVLVACVLTVAVYWYAPPTPRVICELEGNHGSDPDRYEGEIRLTQEMLRRSYHSLPLKLMWAFRKNTFVINHSLKETKLYLGWSAEDDPKYRQGDKDFYPKGTIKVNISERTIQFFRLTKDLRESLSQNAARSAREFVDGYAAHELEHSMQYHVHPVRSLSSVKNPCPDGLCDQELLDETKQKAAYEKEATILGCNFMTIEDVDDLEREMKTLEKNQPQLFAKGGVYSLLGEDFRSYYFETIRAVIAAQNLVGPARIVYEGEFVPAEIVWEIKNLNDQFTPENIPTYRARVEKLRARWQGYFEAGVATEKLRSSYGYIKQVEERFGKELARSRELAQR